MLLRGRRVVIEPLAEGDVAAFTAYRRSPDVARWQSWDADYDEADARRLVAGQPAGLPGPDEWLQLAVRSTDRAVEADWFKGEWTTLDGYAVLAREHRPAP